MVDISLIAKPQIWLTGTLVNGSEFSQRVDHARETSTTSTLVVGGVTQFNDEDILTFLDDVRIIITTIAAPKQDYVREEGKLSPLVFEGKKTLGVHNINLYAETYYTLNGKDPSRSKTNLYNYRDRNDIGTTFRENPSGEDRNIVTDSDLGFVVAADNIGNSLTTVKAITHQKGLKSRIAIATFRIIQNQNTSEFNNVRNQQLI